MKYRIDVASARIIMRGLIWAMEDADATEVEVAEYQIEWYQIGEAFGLLDEDQLDLLWMVRSERVSRSSRSTFSRQVIKDRACRFEVDNISD